MARGPLPSANARRRNAPTISGTSLPAAGRAEKAPRCPYDLGKPGSAWWRWAWHLPQATKWDDGAIYHVARRAQLEDELAALGQADSIDVAEVLDVPDDERTQALSWLIRSLKSHASGSVSVMKEMRELDNRLGLNPKALAEMRWQIEHEAEDEAPADAGAPVRRLRAVDPRAAAVS